MSQTLELLASALAETNLNISKIDFTKKNPIFLVGEPTGVDFAKFANRLVANLGDSISKYTDLVPTLFSTRKFKALLTAYANAELSDQSDLEEKLPEELRGMKLYVDPTSPKRELAFYLTNQNEKLSPFNPHLYMRLIGMSEADASRAATRAVLEYQPRAPLGLSKQESEDGGTYDIFNSYLPAPWTEYEGDLPDELPPLFAKLVGHLFPLPVEREYFFAWLHESLTNRAFVYLVLCGAPGTGKNRLKLVMRALHGHSNTVDGKKSTFSERFNTQLFGNTLTWFDELHYDLDMENQMKEVQNDSIAREAKGVDATRSSKVHASLVVSNNKPRDNYIAFDARKFAPLLVNPKKLLAGMTNDEIGQLTAKVESPSGPGYDLKFVAQIGRWILKHGDPSRWPHLEYKGPMFYRLAHTSMTRWQKKCALLLLNEENRRGPGDKKIVTHEKYGLQWSTVQEFYAKKTRGNMDHVFPDWSSVRHFCDHFVDSQGRRVFETHSIKGDIMSDFYVRQILFDVQILTEEDVIRESADMIKPIESDVNGRREDDNERDDEYDGTDLL